MKNVKAPQNRKIAQPSGGKQGPRAGGHTSNIAPTPSPGGMGKGGKGC